MTGVVTLIGPEENVPLAVVAVGEDAVGQAVGPWVEGANRAAVGDTIGDLLGLAGGLAVGLGMDTTGGL